MSDDGQKFFYEYFDKDFEDYVIVTGRSGFLSLPKDELSQELCNKYIDCNGRLSDVPEKFRTQKLCVLAMQKNLANISDIPVQFRDQDMYDMYISHPNSKLGSVPKEYLTQSLYDSYIIKASADLNRVPEEFRKQKYYDRYVEKGGSLDWVPLKYRTKQICILAMDRGFSLDYVPEGFLTQEMCNIYIKQDGNLHAIPEKFRTQELYDIYIDNGGELSNVPEEFRTRKIYERYMKYVGNLKNVPEEYITQEMCINYIKNGGIFENIPEKFRTKELYDLYYGENLLLIPEEERDSEWHNKYIEHDLELSKTDPDYNLKLKKVYLFLLNVYNKINNKEKLSYKDVFTLVYFKSFYEDEISKYFVTKNLFDKILEKRDIDEDISYIYNEPHEYVEYVEKTKDEELKKDIEFGLFDYSTLCAFLKEDPLSEEVEDKFRDYNKEFKRNSKR